MPNDYLDQVQVGGTTYDLQDTAAQEDLSQLKSQITQLESNVYDDFVKHISDPFIKTNIVLVGDSITAGMGGTGYSTTDETIIGSSQKTNVKDAVCWGNMLYHYLLNNYAGENTVDFSNPKITIASSGINTLGFNLQIGNQAINYLASYSGNSVAMKIINFDFYGESFSILYSKSAIYGIFDVYIDGVLNTSVDCYNTTTTHGVSITIDGLAKGMHTVEIYSTNTKNASSTGKGFYIIAFVLNKEIEYHNYGISGSAAAAGYNTDGRYTADMDFAFVMYGTNNRVTTGTYLRLTDELIGLCDLLKETYGITPILMCATPIAEELDTSGTTVYAFHMNDVERAVSAVAEHYSSPFIDNYDWFLEYSDLKGIDFTTLLVDGLHPNDIGYYVIYRNVIKTLGLPLLPEYREWWHPST